MAKKKENLIGRRLKISKMHQHMLLAVLITSVLVGVTAVFAIYFIKYIVFNTKVITAKDEAIGNYESLIKNVGICKDSNSDGKFTTAELNDCNPNEIATEEVPGSLRYNVLMEMSENKDLESVGRSQLDEACKDSDGKLVDYNKQYDEAKDEDEREEALTMARTCSALRVIPDALPVQENQEALMASLNQLFLLANWEPEALAPSDSDNGGGIEGLGTIPLQVVVEADTQVTMEVLNNIEKSIRPFDFQTATIAWSGETALELRAQANSYYSNITEVTEVKKTVYATKKKGGNDKK